MEALEILQAARKRIARPESWGKGRRRWNRPIETCCAAEAIEEADENRHEYSERVRAFRALLLAAGEDPQWGALPKWNDTPERTHAEVLAAFDLAIATLKL